MMARLAAVRLCAREPSAGVSGARAAGVSVAVGAVGGRAHSMLTSSLMYTVNRRSVVAGSKRSLSCSATSSPGKAAAT